jgi:hypothetical protein
MATGLGFFTLKVMDFSPFMGQNNRQEQGQARIKVLWTPLEGFCSTHFFKMAD